MNPMTPFQEASAIVYDILVAEAGLINHSDYPSDYQRERDAAARETFILNHEKNPAEFNFVSSQATDMKLFYSPFNGFNVYSQIRTVKGITAENKANRALRDAGLRKVS